MSPLVGLFYFGTGAEKTQYTIIWKFANVSIMTKIFLRTSDMAERRARWNPVHNISTLVADSYHLTYLERYRCLEAMLRDASSFLPDRFLFEDASPGWLQLKTFGRHCIALSDEVSSKAGFVNIRKKHRLHRRRRISYLRDTNL